MICKQCTFNVLGLCKACGCVCSAKAHSALEECPEGFWKPYIYEDNGFEYILKEELPEDLFDFFDGELIPLTIWQDFLKENK